MVGIPGIQAIKDGLKEVKSRRLTFLAEDDPRFKIFVYLEKNKIEQANKELEQHKSFFLELAKTQIFLKKFKTMLSHCTESQRRIYLDYFKSHGIVSNTFYVGPSTGWVDALLSTTDPTRESDNEDYDRLWSD